MLRQNHIGQQEINSSKLCLQMLAGFNLEGGKLPPSIMLPSGGGSSELIMNRQIGADGSSSHDTLDRKRSVSFAPSLSDGDEPNRIAIGNISKLLNDI